jgi:hypothetical protein
MVESFIGSNPPGPAYSRTALKGVCEYLVATPRWQDRPHRILTHIDLGSEILYRTPHEVIGTPYHRNARGLLDAHAIWTAASCDEARQLLRGRNIDLVLLSRPERPLAPELASCASPFYQTLLEGDPPDWCVPVELPESLPHSYALFEIVAPGGTDQE